MDVLQAPAHDSAMATADDLMEFSAEGRTPAGDDIDIEFGDGENNFDGEDQDMIEDVDDNLLDDEMADDDDITDAPQQLDTDIDLDVPTVEVLENIEVNMGSRAPSEAATPMTQGVTPMNQGITPLPDQNLEVAAEVEVEAKVPKSDAEHHVEEEIPQENPAELGSKDHLETFDAVLAEVAPDNNAQGHSELGAGEPTDDASAKQEEDVSKEQQHENQDHESKEEITDTLEVSTQKPEDTNGTVNPDTDAVEGSHVIADYLDGEDASHTGPILEDITLHTVVVDYQGSKMSLFPPSFEHEGSESFLLEDEALCYEPISQLLAECRRVLKDDVIDGEELVFNVPCLSVAITEDHAQHLSTTMNNIIDMFLKLSQNDGIETPEALAVVLEVKQKVQSRLEFLQDAIADGKGLSHISAIVENQELSEGDASSLAATSREGTPEQQDESLAQHVDTFEQTFEAHTPVHEEVARHDVADDLDFTSPVKRTNVDQRSEPEPGRTVKDTAEPVGQDIRPGADDFPQEDFVDLHEESFDDIVAPTTEDPLDVNQEFEEAIDTTIEATLIPDTNESSETIQDLHEDGVGGSLLDESLTASGIDVHGASEALEHTAGGEGVDEAAATAFDDEYLQAPGDSESHTERGDESGNVPASPSSLKRRRSYEDASDLLDDTQTPSPQAKRTRPA